MQDVIYLDNAASTPVRSEVRNAMLPYLGDEAFGNPSSSHRVGRRARTGIDTAKREIADALDADPGAVIFTSGGTEADNLAVLGTALAARDRGRPFRVAVATTEHKAILAAAEEVERLGGEAAYLPVDAHGQVRPDAVQTAIAGGLSVLSTMWVNNETGIMQDIPALAGRCADAGVTFHTDAVQAVGKVPCSFSRPPSDLLTISGHKIAGPKGSGAILVRERTALHSMIHGGGQQFGIRPGTENVAGIVGLGRAVALAVREMDATAHALRTLRDDFEARLTTVFADAVIVGRDAPRAPHVACVSLPGIDTEALLMHLDLAGVACSSGSACNTGSVEPSHVLAALDLPRPVSTTAIRFSFYKQNTADDVDRVMALLPELVAKVRGLAETLGRR